MPVADSGCAVSLRCEKSADMDGLSISALCVLVFGSSHGNTAKPLEISTELRYWGMGLEASKKPATAGLFETISILSVINGVPGMIRTSGLWSRSPYISIARKRPRHLKKCLF